MIDDQDIPSRLRRGAKLLGDLWRAGVRCASGWSPSCDCTERTKFCRAKHQWSNMALMTRDWFVLSGPFGVVEAMRLSELEATGRTFEIETPEVGRWKAGPAGLVPLRELLNIPERPDELKALLALFKVFPNSKVVEDTEPHGKREAPSA